MIVEALGTQDFILLDEAPKEPPMHRHQGLWQQGRDSPSPSYSALQLGRADTGACKLPEGPREGRVQMTSRHLRGGRWQCLCTREVKGSCHQAPHTSTGVSITSSWDAILSSSWVPLHRLKHISSFSQNVESDFFCFPIRDWLSGALHLLGCHSPINSLSFLSCIGRRLTNTTHCN